MATREHDVPGGRRAAAAIVGAALVLLGVAALLSMRPDIAAGTLRNADMMSVALGVQFFSGISLIVYTVVTAGKRSISTA